MEIDFEVEIEVEAEAEVGVASVVVLVVALPAAVAVVAAETATDRGPPGCRLNHLRIESNLQRFTGRCNCILWRRAAARRRNVARLPIPPQPQCPGHVHNCIRRGREAESTKLRPGFRSDRATCQPLSPKLRLDLLLQVPWAGAKNNQATTCRRT